MRSDLLSLRPLHITEPLCKLKKKKAPSVHGVCYPTQKVVGIRKRIKFESLGLIKVKNNETNCNNEYGS
jgi:hypothetical protein